MIINHEPEDVQPKRKIVVRRTTKALRDFTNEEKGEDGIDEIEPEIEKEKQSRPRGWNKTEQNGDESSKDNKKKEIKKSKKEKRDRDEKVKMPTADGSRASRLDKENAEKEIKNKNVWAERQGPGENFNFGNFYRLLRHFAPYNVIN